MATHSNTVLNAHNDTRNDLYLRAQALIAEAMEKGFVITCETYPRTPLAMGNYGLYVTVREARAKPIFNPVVG